GLMPLSVDMGFALRSALGQRRHLPEQLAAPALGAQPDFAGPRFHVAVVGLLGVGDDDSAATTAPASIGKFHSWSPHNYAQRPMTTLATPPGDVDVDDEAETCHCGAPFAKT